MSVLASPALSLPRKGTETMLAEEARKRVGASQSRTLLTPQGDGNSSKDQSSFVQL